MPAPRGPILCVLLIATAMPAAAQFGPSADPCTLGTAQASLRGALVEAALFTNSNLFYGNQTSAGYRVPTNEVGPNGAPPSPIYHAALWLGALVGGEVRTAAARYAGFTFRPGQTGPDGTPPTPAECAEADRIWTVTRDDVAAYLAGGPPTADLAEWPVHLGAPVLDGDGIAGNYDLAAGDQPALRGDVTAFWAMTDTAVDLGGPDGLNPLGVDVTVEAFAFRTAPFWTETAYRYTITNRNAVPVDSAYAGFFLDPDLGNAGDDYLGTDTTAHMIYAYNGQETDTVYGVPPAVGVVVAEGPVGPPNGQDDDGDGEADEPGERLGLTSSSWLNGSGPIDDPRSPPEVYNRLQGLWNDGTPMRARGEGYGYGRQSGAPITTFTFFGDPVTGEGWSEVNYDGEGPHYYHAGDRRGALSTGPFRLGPGESASVTFGIVFAQGTGHLNSIVRLRPRARAFREAALAGQFDPVAVDGPPIEVPFSVRRPRPNPFTGAAAVEVRGAPPGTAVSVYDALGRRVAGPEAVGPSGTSTAEVGRGLAPGVYLVRVAGFAFEEAFTVTKVR